MNKPWYTAWWGWASIILLTAASCVFQVVPTPEATATFTPIPRATSTEMPATPTVPPRTPEWHYYYTVQPGDTLWDIAVDKYGTGLGWWMIYDANRKTIADPHWIYVDQKIIIP